MSQLEELELHLAAMRYAEEEAAASPRRYGDTSDDGEEEYIEEDPDDENEVEIYVDPSIRPTVRFIEDKQEFSAIEDLASGLLSNLNVPLQQLNEYLLELERNQQALIATLADENEKVENMPHWKNITEVMAKVPVYHNKLHHMRANMNALSERVKRLNARASKLKQRKMAMEEKDRQLTAQPSPSLLLRTREAEHRDKGKDKS